MAGEAFQRYGGSTSCVALSRDGEDPSLLLDGGTGLRNVTRLLEGRPFSGAVLLSHLHWDHIGGLPFFAAADRGRVDLRAPSVDGLRRAFGPPLFPLELDQLRGSWTFDDVAPGAFSAAGWDFVAREIPHGGGRTLGYRVTDGRSSLAYVTDHCPTLLGPGTDGLGERHDAVLELADGVDLLVHDAQLTASELPSRSFLGHAAVEYVLALGAAAGARQVVLFHHDPDRTDEQLDELAIAYPTGTFAHEGLVVDLGPRTA